MTDNLSQDELDNLLAGMGDDAGGQAPGADTPLSNDEFGVLESMFSPAWAKLAGNMSQSLGHEVTIDFGVASGATGSALAADIESLGIFLHFEVTAAGVARHGMVLQKEEVAKLGALLSSEDPAAATLTAEMVQAVVDLLEMSLPIVAGSLQEALGESFEFGTVEAVNTEDPSTEFDADALGLGGPLVRLEYAMVIGDIVACPMLYMLPVSHARELLARVPTPEPRPAPAPAETPFAEFESAQAAAAPAPGIPGGSNIDLIMDIELEVVARLGSIQMSIREILKLGPGAIIDIDRAADAPVELVVNDKLVARGDVVVVQENFGLKISEVPSTQERIASLRK